MFKLVCQFTDGHTIMTKVFRSWARIRCLHKAALYQSEHGLACLAMKYA